MLIGFLYFQKEKAELIFLNNIIRTQKTKIILSLILAKKVYNQLLCTN